MSAFILGVARDFVFPGTPQRSSPVAFFTTMSDTYEATFTWSGISVLHPATNSPADDRHAQAGWSERSYYHRNIRQCALLWTLVFLQYLTLTSLQWSKSTKLVRSWEGSFSTTLKFPWGSRILFKYIVDSQWVTSRHEKTETDPNGNVNNVFQVPPKPESTTLASVARTAVETQTAAAPSPKPVTDPSVKDTVVKTLTSVKNSALATEGVQPLNVTSYIASAFGAAVATVTGVDPINAPKVTYLCAIPSLPDV